MNSLSLLIYFADVLQNFQLFITIMCIIGGIISFILAAIGFGTLVDCNLSSKEEVFYWKTFKSGIIGLISVIIILGLNCFIPSSKTMYMIAASEMSEELIKNPKAQEILSDLEVVIRENLSDLKNGD